MKAFDRLAFLLVRVTLYALVFSTVGLMIYRWHAGAIPLDTCICGVGIVFVGAAFSTKRIRRKE